MRFALLAAVVFAFGALPSSAPAAATRAKGIDVSNWQHTINWPKVADAGLQLRVRQGDGGHGLLRSDVSDEPQRQRRATGSSSARTTSRAPPAAAMPRSPRARSRRPTTSSPSRLPQPGELPPVLDLEVTGGLGPTLLTVWTQAWLDEVYARTGVRGFVYTSPDFWSGNLANTTQIAASGYGLWIAHWTSASAPIRARADLGRPGLDVLAVDGQEHRPRRRRQNRRRPPERGEADLARDRALLRRRPAFPDGAVARRRPRGRRPARRSPGTWTGGKPVVFSYQWKRCDAAGANCVAIAGATAESYRAGFGRRRVTR